MRIGEIIKQKRIEKNITQEELASKLHVTRQAISNWENNKSVPDIEFVRQLAIEFDMSIDEMLINDVQANDKRSRNNSKFIFILVVVIIFIIAGLIWLASLFLTNLDDPFEGQCSVKQLNTQEIHYEDGLVVIATYEEVVLDGLYCVPVTYEFEYDQGFMSDGQYLQDQQELHITLPEGYVYGRLFGNYRANTENSFILGLTVTIIKDDKKSEIASEFIVEYDG